MNRQFTSVIHAPFNLSPFNKDVHIKDGRETRLSHEVLGGSSTYGHILNRENDFGSFLETSQSMQKKFFFSKERNSQPSQSTHQNVLCTTSSSGNECKWRLDNVTQDSIFVMHFRKVTWGEDFHYLLSLVIVNSL